MNKVIKLSATWCGPCKQFAPIFNEVVDRLPDTWESLAIDIDTDEGREIMIANNIRSVPTTIFMEVGKEPQNITGVMTTEQLEDKLGM
jgi:thioredoxin 1